MPREISHGHAGQLAEDLWRCRDDELGIADRARRAHPVWLATRDEQYLIRIADDVVPVGPPDEQAAIRKADLKVRRETFWPRAGGHDGPHVFDDADGRGPEACA